MTRTRVWLVVSPVLAGGVLVTVVCKPDMAFIDGRGRVRSCLDALRIIKSGGWLVLDDSDRERYAEARRAAEEASAARIVFRNGSDETTAWRIK